jgi:hypothetical protein
VSAQFRQHSAMNTHQAQDIDKIVEGIPEWEGLLRIATYLSLMAVEKQKSISARTGTLTSYHLIKTERMEKHFSSMIQAFVSNEWFVSLFHIS